MAKSKFCAEEAAPRKNLLCQVSETSNIGVLGVIDSDVTIPTLTTAADFVTFIKGQVFACKATIIQNVVASKPRSAEVAGGRNYGGRTNPAVESKDHTISGYDRDHLDNTAWWNSMVKDATDQRLFYVTKNYVFFSAPDSELSISFGTVIAEDGKTQIDGAFDIKWNEPGEPIPNRLDGVRSKLNSTDDFLFTFTSTPTVYTESGGEVFTIANNTANANIVFAVVESSSQPLTFKLLGNAIPGLVLGSDGVLTGTPTTAGTYQRDISATNPCGAYGLLRIKVIVTA